MFNKFIKIDDKTIFSPSLSAKGINFVGQLFENNQHSLQKDRWSGGRLLCSIIFKSMLSEVLILIIWPKWVHKHLQEVAKKRIQLGKTLQRICIDIEELILLIENVSN